MHCLFLMFCVIQISMGADEPLDVFSLHRPGFSVEPYKTNTTFVTDDGHIYFKKGFLKYLDPQKFEAAKKFRESLPAKDFPEGNWGLPVEGIQVSLRFNKSSYTNGELIDTIVLVRNTTNEYFLYPPCNNKVTWREVDFKAYTSSNQLVESKPLDNSIHFGGPLVSLLPGIQNKYENHLNDTYDLTNGSYLVQAAIEFSGGTSPNGEWIEIKSAKVPIEIK